MTFKYKKKSKPKGDYLLPPVLSAEPGEEYTGFVLGTKASHGEENLYRAILKNGRAAFVWFRFAIGAPMGFPGQKELDFLIRTYAGVYVAIQVRDYDYVHHGEQARSKDLYSDMFILEELNREGIEVLDGEIKSIDDDDLQTVRDAQNVVEKMML